LKVKQRNVKLKGNIYPLSDNMSWLIMFFSLIFWLSTTQTWVFIDGFPIVSEANSIATFWYNEWWEDMLQTMICENWAFDHTIINSTRDYGLCQLHYNKTNRVWIDDERWGDIWYQANVCLDKRKAVKRKSIWMCYNKRHKYKDRYVLVPNK
jgi:hypothetical protein